MVAEGNTFKDNISRVLTRNKDEHIRAHIRIPNNFIYFGETWKCMIERFFHKVLSLKG